MELYFCTDSTLRLQFSPGEPMIPLQFLHEHEGTSDLAFWSKWWHQAVYFERGLTLSQFLIALEPWAKFWSDFTNTDIAQYIAEVKKPVSAMDNRIDWIGISYMHKLILDSEKQDNDLMRQLMKTDIKAWLKTKKPRRLTGKWQIQSGYDVNGYVTGNVQPSTIHHTPINYFANIPLILNSQQTISILDFERKKHLSPDQYLIQNGAFGVCKIDDFQFLVADRHHSLQQVIQGFFSMWFKNPMERDSYNQVLLLQARGIAESQKPKDNTQSNGSVTLGFASGAFSPLIEEANKEKAYWNNMKELAKKDNNVVLKIGKLKIATPPENRLHHYIISPDDREANPQPTPYKT